MCADFLPFGGRVGDTISKNQHLEDHLQQEGSITLPTPMIYYGREYSLLNVSMYTLAKLFFFFTVVDQWDGVFVLIFMVLITQCCCFRGVKMPIQLILCLILQVPGCTPYS